MPAKGSWSNPGGGHTREKRFRQFEVELGVILRNWPAASQFAPETCVPMTLAAGLRDAANGYIFCAYPSVHLDPNRDKFIEIWGKVKVSTRSDCVIVGPPNAAVIPSNTTHEASPFLCEITNITEPQLKCISYLFYTKALAKPVLLLGTIPQDVKLYADTSIESTADGQFVIF